jgi:hypothetical protein
MIKLRHILAAIIIGLGLSMCVSGCTYERLVQDKMMMWTFKEYADWRRYGQPDGLIEHWVVNDMDRYIYLTNQNKVRNPGDQEYWPIH